MSRFLNEDALAIGVSTIIGAGIAFNAYKFVKRIVDDKPPKKWRKVGEISDLWIFPIKSCGPVVVNEIDCKILGPANGYLRDRVFIVTRPCGELVTARTYPKMVRILPKIEGKILTVSTSGMPDLVIDIEKLHSSKETIKVTVWKDSFVCTDVGDEAAKWFSKAILGEDKGFRFAFYPSDQPKPEVADRKYLFEQAEDADTGAMADETSFMMMNQGSFDDLNTKMEKSVTALQYRPNFLVKGPEPWAEDGWKWVKIGDDAVFKFSQPSLRCVFTNIDPATGERQVEPLKTLKGFRTFKGIAPSPFFGIHLGIRRFGKVKKGDAVYVSDDINAMIKLKQ